MSSRLRPSGARSRWRWLAAKIWRDPDDWVLIYRDSYPQSDIELIDRRIRKGYIEIKGDLVRLTRLGKRDLRLPDKVGGRSVGNDSRAAGT